MDEPDSITQPFAEAPLGNNPTPKKSRHIINSCWFSILVPAVVGYGASLLCVVVAERYGAVLFVAVPFLVSFLSAFFHGFKVHRSFGSAYMTAVLSILVLGAMIFLTALDGMICLIMALPLALILALMGTALGGLAGQAATKRFASVTPLALTLMFPFLVAFEDSTSPAAPERAIVTSIPIMASVQSVWDKVIAFPRIDQKPDGLFRFGIAYPIEARIEGSGIGAIRYCTFSTGSFVEPITAWQPNELLAFNVTSSPPPMEEFSIYEHVDAPHLHGHMQSHRGQFRLVPVGNNVLLEGTTWYHHEMWPQWYWGPITDQIIHKIHERVLNHIKTTAENKR